MVELVSDEVVVSDLVVVCSPLEEVVEVSEVVVFAGTEDVEVDEDESLVVVVGVEVSEGVDEDEEEVVVVVVEEEEVVVTSVEVGAIDELELLSVVRPFNKFAAS